MLKHWRSQIAKHYVKRKPILHKSILSPQKHQELLATFSSNDYKLDTAIQDLQKVKNLTTLQYKNRVFLHILEIPNQKIDLRLYRKVVQRIATLIEMFRGPVLEFWFLPSKQLRVLPPKDHLITSSDVNGGFTFFKLGKIYIFRESEFPKVALHETLHNLELFDMRNWRDDDLKQLYDAFHLNYQGCQTTCMTCCHTQLEPNEAIIELWAILFQILFVAHEMDFDMKTLNQMVLIEQRWAQQMSQLLIDRGALNPDQVWKEETHLFSYILLKSALLQDLDTFLMLQKPYNSHTMTQYMLECVGTGGFAQGGLFETQSFRFAWFSDE
jgi:hypothetical protein